MREQDPGTIREAAEEILRRPEYREPEPGLVEQAIDWIGRQLERLSSFGGGASGGGYAVGWILLLLVGVALVWMLVRVMPRRFGRTVAADVQVETEVRVRTNRDTWLERAAAAEREGRFRDAVHARYRATVAGLLDRDELPEDEGATSGEYTSAFDPTPPRGPSFVEASGRFEDVWYGGAAADGSDARVMTVLDNRVLDNRVLDESPPSRPESAS